MYNINLNLNLNLNLTMINLTMINLNMINLLWVSALPLVMPCWAAHPSCTGCLVLCVPALGAPLCWRCGARAPGGMARPMR